MSVAALSFQNEPPCCVNVNCSLLRKCELFPSSAELNLNSIRVSNIILRLTSVKVGCEMSTESTVATSSNFNHKCGKFRAIETFALCFCDRQPSAACQKS
jgi:hypothetical protein